MNRVEATRELRRRTEASVNEKVTHVALTVELAQAILAVLAPEDQIVVGDRVTIPDDEDGTETGTVLAVARAGYTVRPDKGLYNNTEAGLWYHSNEISLLGGEG